MDEFPSQNDVWKCCNGEIRNPVQKRSAVAQLTLDARRYPEALHAICDEFSANQENFMVDLSTKDSPKQIQSKNFLLLSVKVIVH